ncbi:hypothetical protein [Lacimicrobium sp. SS2-24]|uniref:hypothetical protein n=1 Tax=Lacimicrobium sp. SS2-24 TaxID=2005569 RepID=UPI0011307E60|nr:hypothetical protein [Lacimicrobium sp. SS2-24]
MMNFETKQLQETIEDLKRHRDEINVQMHLARAEMRDEWNGLEKKWDALQSRFSAIKKDTGESSKEVRAALSLLTEEVGEAYKRFKKRLKS